jgi:HEAT repeats
MPRRSPTGSLADWAASVWFLATLAKDVARGVLFADDARDWYTPVWRARRDGDANFLIGALNDRDHRSVAAMFLGQLHAVGAAPAIVPLLDASDRVTRASAIRALAALECRDFDERLRTIARNDPSEMVRRWAVDALGESGNVPSLSFARLAFVAIGLTFALRGWRRR